MQPIDHSQYSDRELAEAYRREVIQHMERQTKALESLRSIAVLFTVLFVIGAVAWVIVAAGSSV